MSMKLNDLLEACPQVRLSLEAGREGLERAIGWVHVLESPAMTGYLHGGEMVLATGCLLEGPADVLAYVKRLHAQGASAVALDVGNFIPEIPADVIHFCNDHGFPLFSIPKDEAFERVAQPLCNCIVKENEKNHQISTALKNAIFFHDRHELYLVQLSELHFETEWRYAICAVELFDTAGDPYARTEGVADTLRAALHRRVPTSAVIVSDREILAVIHCESESELGEIAASVKALVERQLQRGERMTIGVGKLTRSLRCLYKSYHQAKAIMRIQEKRSMLDAGYVYADMGAYRLLLGIEDREIVDDYLATILGPLIEYDKLKGTDLVAMLRAYLFNNGSVQDTAAEMYVHRNTVNYRINRAADVLGMDLGSLDMRLQLMLCFLLQDMQ